MNNAQHYPHHLKAFKYFGMALFVILPFVSFLIGYQYEQGFFDTADPRTRIFITQQQCESFTDRKCIPTLCESNPQHASCATNNKTGWFATRQPLTIPSPSTEESQEAVAQQCSNAGGSWLAEFDECENLDQIECQEAGGTFNDCVSACRHNPGAEICIQVCVPVCTF